MARNARSRRTSVLSALARAGYAARGFVYLVVGGLAFTAALGGGNAPGSKGALSKLLEAPGGRVLLVTVAVGLVGYALWRFVQSVFDADHHGRSAKGLAIRGSLLVSAGTHLLLAAFAASLAFGWNLVGGVGSSSGDSHSTPSLVARAMVQPFGRWIVGIAGVCIVGAGVAQFAKGVKQRFRRFLDVPYRHERWVFPVSRVGLIARGIAFAMIGGFVIAAAVEADPSEARGLSGAFAALRQQPYGGWLLAILAAGLFAFGVYSILEAIFRRIDEPEPLANRP